jgi:crossover junction endodeoxyribonuclease RuvC
MLMLGIDPGTATTGFAFVREAVDGTYSPEKYGVVTTPAEWVMPRRLQSLYRQLSDLIATYKPDCGAIEELFFGKNITTAITVAQGRGVALLAMANAGLVIREFTPAEVKQSIAGYGNAPKQQMQTMVKTLLNLDTIPKPDDAADALAVALTALQNAEWERRVTDGA